jgi:NitT/TauT family transport system substrate-binding protein
MLRIALTSIACAVSLAFTAPAQAQEKTLVRMGTPALALWMLPLLVADDKGFVAEEGLALKINYMRGGPEALAALIGKNIDIMSGALSGILILRSKGVPVKVVSGMAGVRTFALVVDAKRHAGVTDISQMKGMRIATARRGSDSDLVLRVLLDDAKLRPDRDVNLIQIGGYENHLTAIEKGEVDASMILEPFLTFGVQKGLIKPVIDLMAGQGPEALSARIWTAMAATEELIQQRRDMVQGLVRSVGRGVKYIDENEDGTVEVARKHFPAMDAGQLREIIKRSVRVKRGRGFLTEITPEAIELENKFLIGEKLIPAAQRYEDVVATDMRTYWQSSR